jgi:carboxyl-terminal processing protease
MKSRLRPLLMAFLVIAILILGMVGGVALDREVLIAYAQPQTATGSNSLNLQLINEAWSLINRVYVDRSAVQSQTQTYGAISGMVDSLGDTGHSTFLSPQMVKEENNFTAGQFEGIGAEVEEKNNQVVIVAPIDNSPAQRAGLQPGDVIEKVNGSDVSGLPLDQVVAKILGPAGTQVTLAIVTPSTGQTREVTITRARITVNNVSWSQIPGTTLADVRIVGFSQGVSDDLQKALADIKQQGMTGIVLDLRNNPGGLLSEAVGTTSQFITSGNVLLEKDAQGKTTPVQVETSRPTTDLPVVVLINGGTASASEIVSGALQDAHRAQLVGETTFGTGTVLNQFSLSDGSALLLATQEWLTPSGRVIWHHGITPDVTVTLTPGTIPVLPETMRGMTSDQLKSSGDAQLLKAIDLLSPHSSGLHHVE